MSRKILRNSSNRSEYSRKVISEISENILRDIRISVIAEKRSSHSKFFQNAHASRQRKQFWVVHLSFIHMNGP